jgi:hypothetical protein
VNRCRLDGDPLRDAVALMERYRTHWEGQLDAFKRYLERETTR